MNEKNKIIISICCKVALIISVIVGVLYSFFFGHVHGVSTLLYFTVQSNIWIMIVDIILIIFLIKVLKTNNYELDNRLYLVKQIFTVAITITSLVYLLVLVPGYYLMSDPIEGYHPFNLGGTLLHIVVPAIAIVDFLLFTRKAQYNKTSFLWALIPPCYYLGFSAIGYFLKWDFGNGRNYPYFFMNYDSPAGFFGFSKTMPYFMGSFYWMLVVVGLVIGISALLIFINNKLKNRQAIKNK